MGNKKVNQTNWQTEQKLHAVQQLELGDAHWQFYRAYRRTH